MRLKHIKGAEEAVASNKYVIHDPAGMRGRWSYLFENEAPLSLEIGMGKGRFIMDTAAADPASDYLGMERSSSVALRAVQKMEAAPLPNLYFICADANWLCDYFEPGEISRIYLNFSDPWPKKRHANRRLTSPAFLARYEALLSEGGLIEFKTDNTALFDFSVESFESCNWSIQALTRDLHNDPVMGAGNIMTEYEERFSSQGNPIFKLIARRP